MVKTKIKKNRNRKTKKGGAAAAMNSSFETLVGTGIPYHDSNNYLPPGYQFVGRGASKYVYRIPGGRPGYLYINSTPLQRHTLGITRAIMLEEYAFAIKIYEAAPGFFPNVAEAWNTPNKFVYMKEECERYDVGVIGPDMLLPHIRNVVLLMRHRLFTLDLKVENMGTSRIDGHSVLLDFSPENSFKLRDSCPIADLELYVSLSIFILLIHCWNNSRIPHTSLQEIARDFIPLRCFQRFGIFFNIHYNVSTDPNIDYEFNRSVAPTLSRRVVQPIDFITAYGRPPVGRPPVRLDQLIAELTATLQ
jgi:hypothetical protein